MRISRKKFKTFFAIFVSRPTGDRTGRISALNLFWTDVAVLGPYGHDLGPILSQYGPRAWLTRYIYYTLNSPSVF